MIRRCLNCMNEFEVPAGYEYVSLCCPHCGYLENTPPREVYHLYPGTILQNRYILGTVLGFGGFGITYKAWDETLGIVVAIKEYYPTGLVQRVPGEGSVIVYEGSKRDEYYSGLVRFLDEAKNMARFYNNANIVHVENYFEANGTAYIVMEYLDGMSLKGYMRQVNGRVPYDFAIGVIRSIAAALCDIHGAMILHRDISPDNIFICRDGVVKLIDFGAARFSDEEREMTRSIILKPGYAPPEQYQSKSRQGPWTDIYALSATMYRMVTGQVPDESTNRVIADEMPAPKEILPDIPEYLNNIIMKGMALNPELRFKDVYELLYAIDNKSKILDVKKELKRRKRKRVIQVAALIMVVVLGGVSIFNIYHKKKKRVILDSATVTIWFCIDENETEKQLEEMAEAMCSQFKEDQTAIKIEVECIPHSEYNDRLKAAIDEGNMPTIYESDCADSEITKQAIKLDEVFEYIDEFMDVEKDCYFLGQYKDSLKEGKKLPTGFNVPVVYVRRATDIDIETVTISDWNQLTNDNTLGYYVPDRYLNMLSKTLGNKGQVEIGMLYYENDEAAMSDFEKGNITYYVASVREFDNFNEKVAGLYEMRPFDTDSIKGEFCNYFSIDKSANEDEELAACMLLSYMLLERSQKVIHVSNSNALPVNTKAYEQLLDNNRKYKIIDEYLDKLTF